MVSLHIMLGSKFEGEFGEVRVVEVVDLVPFGCIVEFWIDF